jgi:hypothetical protein
MAAAALAATLLMPPLTGPQMRIVRLDEQRVARAIDIEGSPRSAKSWGAGFFAWKLALRYPGIQVFYTRYQEHGLIQLRDVWSKVSVHFPEYLHPRWNSKDECWDFPNGEWIGEVYTGSRVFLSPIKSTEIDSVHSKYKGKTLAVVIIEEAQEVPHVNYLGLKERLSQSRTPDGKPFRYPLLILLVHNCVDEDHWIAKEFPLGADGETCSREGHLHIRADLYSNAKNLGPDVMEGYERDYPPGHTLRRTVIEGKRGVTLVGSPVYGNAFQKVLHVGKVEYVNYYPLLEGWDFGEEKPAVVWFQYLRHLAAIRVLGAVKGSELFLELFAPRVLEIRQRLFPDAVDVRAWCDPTGATGNGGLQFTPITLLHQLGITARPAKDSTSSRDGNDAEVRYKAIQTVAGYMLRSAADGSPAFQVAPMCIELVREGKTLVEKPSHILVTAFEAGYIWDTKAASEDKPNIRKPKKGTRYDDLMNALEYPVIGEAIPLAPSVQELMSAAAAYQTAPERAQLKATMEQARLLRAAQRDSDPYDKRSRAGGGRSRRGGL